MAKNYISLAIATLHWWEKTFAKQQKQWHSSLQTYLLLKDDETRQHDLYMGCYEQSIKLGKIKQQMEEVCDKCLEYAIDIEQFEVGIYNSDLTMCKQIIQKKLLNYKER